MIIRLQHKDKLLESLLLQALPFTSNKYTGKEVSVMLQSRQEQKLI